MSPVIEPPTPHPASTMMLYKHDLDRITSPSKENMLSILRYLESELVWLKFVNADSERLELLHDLEERTKLLREVILKKKRINNKKIVFFREMVHHIEEDYLLFIPDYQLCAEAYKINELLNLSNLPTDLIKRWGRKLEAIIEDLSGMVKEDRFEPVNKVQNIREILWASLNLINRSIDSSFTELYMVKINNVSQMALLPLNILILIAVYNVLGIMEVVDNKTLNFIVYLSLGAFGGSLSAIISKGKQSLMKGSFPINFLLNVIARPVLGAASAVAIILLVQSQLLFAITNDPDKVGRMSFYVPNISLGYQALALVSGFGGEKLLKNTMDSIINKLSVDASKLEDSHHPAGT